MINAETLTVESLAKAMYECMQEAAVATMGAVLLWLRVAHKVEGDIARMAEAAVTELIKKRLVGVQLRAFIDTIGLHLREK